MSASYLLALVLVNAPPGSPTLPVSAEEWPSARAALIALGVEWEILDAREARFARMEELELDVNELRRRRRDLADAPHLADAMRFPPRGVTEELISFNRAYRANLERRMQQQPGGADLNEALRETDQLFHVWSAVRDARCDVYYVAVRREALKRLRTLVGPEAYYTGQLPPHVPVWRFVEKK